jgi:hypothetical protein
MLHISFAILCGGVLKSVIAIFFKEVDLGRNLFFFFSSINRQFVTRLTMDLDLKLHFAGLTGSYLALERWQYPNGEVKVIPLSL